MNLRSLKLGAGALVFGASLLTGASVPAQAQGVYYYPSPYYRVYRGDGDRDDYYYNRRRREEREEWRERERRERLREEWYENHRYRDRDDYRRGDRDDYRWRNRY